MARAVTIDEFPLFSRSTPLSAEELAGGAVINVDKPEGWTSFHVIRELRKATGVKKMGHAGTLDPMASGVLLICCHRATKSIDQLQNLPKTYTCEVTFGSSTPSYDAETTPDAHAGWEYITRDILQQTLKETFEGEIYQKAPMYSARKHEGKRLYELARKGEHVERKATPATIYWITLDDFREGRARLTVHCSKGTYIRTLAHDLGQALGSLAHLSALTRRAIGDYHIDDALTPSEIKTMMAS